MKAIKAIKAYRCYCCGELFPKDNGLIFGKKCIFGISGDKEIQNHSFCPECADRMMFFARVNRKKSLEQLKEEIEQ